MKMTFSEQMVMLARAGVSALGNQCASVDAYVRSQRSDDGGFHGRGEASDLYYTAFGLECLSALQIDDGMSAPARAFLESARLDDLDPIHLACAARAWARLGRDTLPVAVRDAAVERLAAFQLPDHGYRVALSEPAASPYGGFLATSVHEDLGVAPPDPHVLIASFAACRTPDGAYNNETDMEDGATPATAGVVLLQTQTAGGPSPDLLEWLLSRYVGGGFEVFPDCPLPDLLSTAIALYALSAAQIDISTFCDDCRGFVMGLQRADGGFCAHMLDDESDLEYTFYGLMALGCLASC